MSLQLTDVNVRQAVTLGGAAGEPDLAVRTGAEGPQGFEIGKLLTMTGLVTYDPGYGNTAARSSAVTYVDGDAGILRYRR